MLDDIDVSRQVLIRMKQRVTIGWVELNKPDPLATAYRYIDRGYDDGYVVVELVEFDVVKFTPCGFRIANWRHTRQEKEKKFVLLPARKQYAHLTKADALESFKQRKRRQIMILKGQLKQAEIALAKGENIKLEEEG